MQCACVCLHDSACVCVVCCWVGDGGTFLLPLRAMAVLTAIELTASTQSAKPKRANNWALSVLLIATIGMATGSLAPATGAEHTEEAACGIGGGDRSKARRQ